MSDFNDSKKVSEQNDDVRHANDKNLSARIKLHEKHSTTAVDVNDWYFEQYRFTAPYRILELGCGNGRQWEGRIEGLPAGSLLVLSDLSDGMMNTAWRKYSQYSNVLVQKIDIQEIPFPDGSFDRIIANHMLYHVPELSKALAEVKRVLRPDGIFYSSANGSGGMRTYLHDALKRFNPKLDAFKTELSFTLQNGKKLLGEYFNNVRLVEFEDSLKITDTQDLVDWIKSTVTITTSYSEKDLDGLYDFFEAIRVKEGAINIPKEIGMFISSKI
jgi:ubiquinone/menaquinone biosynthesis C-methylase UbiE